MNKFEIREIRYDEYETLLDVMNTSFGFVDDEAKFEHILPKLYYKDNPNMIHIGAFVEGKLVTSIGLYLFNMINNDKRISIACVGAVSTLPEYRNKGYFTKVLNRVIEKAKELNLDLLYLGGDRTRYNHFGFETAGRCIYFNLNKRNLSQLKEESYELYKLEENDTEVIKELLDLYNKEPMRIERTLDNFYKTLISWNCTPYYVKQDGKIVGYFTYKEKEVDELIFNTSIDTMFRAILDVSDYVMMELPMKYYKDVLDRADWYVIRFADMFKILNLHNVINFLGGNAYQLDHLKNKDELEVIRLVLGDAAYDSVIGDNMFISRTNGG